MSRYAMESEKELEASSGETCACQSAEPVSQMKASKAKLGATAHHISLYYLAEVLRVNAWLK